MRSTVGKTTVTLELGDITGHKADAIVNAANSSLLGGGGVDGAIHRRGGPDILAQCRDIAANQGPLPPGDAVSTNAGKLLARRVLHTVGPIWRGGDEDEPETLVRCYRSCLELARQEGLRTVAFPSISTGAYGYPIDQAAQIATGAVVGFLHEHPASFDRITWVLFEEKTFGVYASALSAISAGKRSSDS
ncbi:MAG: O-acetyl-ADP-ribose deacetylase [Myxococcota bacterium]|jgi:O-acetyl-ADP-ribose deacetylase (regulator of RNase III)|nr:O-acetyl-ADP-ribose deacetylase [Myxococcota bacterium]